MSSRVTQILSFLLIFVSVVNSLQCEKTIEKPDDEKEVYTIYEVCASSFFQVCCADSFGCCSKYSQVDISFLVIGIVVGILTVSFLICRFYYKKPCPKFSRCCKPFQLRYAGDETNDCRSVSSLDVPDYHRTSYEPPRSELHVIVPELMLPPPRTATPLTPPPEYTDAIFVTTTSNNKNGIASNESPPPTYTQATS